MPSKKKKAASVQKADKTAQPDISTAQQKNGSSFSLTKYSSQVVLQLGFIAFSLFLAPNATFTGDTRIAPSLAPLIEDPQSTLALSCVGVAFVQFWFGQQLRRLAARERKRPLSFKVTSFYSSDSQS
jgi:hypothetical protein